MSACNRILVLALLALFPAACTSQPQTAADAASRPLAAATDRLPESERAALDAALATLFRDHAIRTAGVGRLRGGELVYTGYFGEQRPGVPASEETMFNVGSITKVVTAETVLRLAARGEIALDEPMSAHWVDPDLVDDPRHEQLTPRMALTHVTGFPNWRFFLEDNRLAFLHDPGTAFGYSGEGFEYLARFVEEKLGRDFGELVDDLVLEPYGMSDAAYRIDPETFPRIARPYADGDFLGHYCRPNGWCREAGSYSAADDMAVSLESLARFLTAVARHEGYPETLASDRGRVHARKGEQAMVDCGVGDGVACPEDQGYGLGWEVLDYGAATLLSHGGSDWHELAIAYIEPESEDGVLVLLNAPPESALPAMAAAIERLDPGSPLAHLYRRWAALAAARAD